MDNLRTKTVGVCDTGLFVDFAVRLARDFGKVYYIPTWLRQAPRKNQAFIGTGLEGIEIAESLSSVKSKVDLWVFPDCCFGPLQQELANEGRLVWGSRMGEELELYRDSAKTVMRRLGIPIGPYKVVRGITALRKYLETHEDVYVKINKWRGSFESFHSTNVEKSKSRLNEAQWKLEPFEEVTDFIVEDALPDRVELGTDLYTIDGQYPTQLLAGIEIKDRAYAGIFTKFADLPKPLTDVNMKLVPLLRSFRYRGNISTEVRIGIDHVGYPVDLTCRNPEPPSSLFQELYTNISQIVWEGANGRLVDPIPAAKYGAQAIICSDWATEHSFPIDFPPEYRRFIKLRNAVKIGKQYYTVPQDTGYSEVGSVIGMGDTMEAAIDMVKKVAEKVTSEYDIEIEVSAFDDANGGIEKMEKFGLKMF